MAHHIPGPLYFEQVGTTGTPMMFLHSTPDDHRYWMFQTAHFSSWYRCLAVDLAGYGRSPAVQSGVTIEDQADACWEIIDKYTSGAAIIHGNSFGSEVAMRMAMRQPKRVEALILSGCGYVASPEVFLRWAQRYRDEGLALRHYQVVDHFAPAGQQSPILRHYADMVVELNNEGTLASIVAVNEALSKRPNPALYDRIVAPTLIAIGELDRTRPLSGELQQRIKGSRLEIVPGVGHACNIEAPAAYDDLSIEFLKKLGIHPGSP